MKQPGSHICIIGGGAAGTFAAVQAAQQARASNANVTITLMEATGRMLQKVRISGGGRCNVTHHEFDIRSFSQRFPRGNKEVLSPMHQFQAQDLVAWFEDHGVELKTEEDGRMFPVTDSSETVIQCLLDQAQNLGVKILKNHKAKRIEQSDQGFDVFDQKDRVLHADKVFMATGSSPQGYEMVKALGHNITPLAPSLFSFKISDPRLLDLQGMAFPNAQVTTVVDGKRFSQEGPLLITHWGLSGPCVLVLSAWAAREMKKVGYQTQITVNWVGMATSSVDETLLKLKTTHPSTKIKNTFALNINKRFWHRLLGSIAEKPCAEISNADLYSLSKELTQARFEVLGKNRFKDEFVECGGVDLRQINMKTMESKLVKGLYFGGEVMDVDGVTGGFNLQHAWTSGYVAGNHMVESF